MAFWLFIVGVGIYTTAAGITDLRMRRIPNYLTVTTAIAGLACAVLKWLDYPHDLFARYPTDWLNCLLGFALGFGIFFIPFALGGGGSGDVKLVAALGAWLGWFHLLLALAVSLIIAMILAFVVWAARFAANSGNRDNKSGGSGTRSVPSRKARHRSAVPFAIPMALGAWCILGLMIVEDISPNLFQTASPQESAAGEKNE